MNEKYSHFGDMPEIPEIIPEDDQTAEHLMGCMYGIALLVLVCVAFIFIFLVFHG